MKKIDSESYDIKALQRRLCYDFNYDPETGIVTWKNSGKEWGAKWWQRTTKKPGGISANYRLDGPLEKFRSCSVHKAIWIMVYGEMPPGLVIDHRDGNPFNNRLSNLRLATHAQNIANSEDYRLKKDGLPRGVYRRNKKFQAACRKDGKLHHLGTFNTPEEAHQIYLEKARELHGEFFKHQTKGAPPSFTPNGAP